ncbi:MAG TPA: acyl-CoA dehydrogenase family protein [Candidatus Thermoplasmatota archaeon]
MDFALSEDDKLFQQTVRTFAMERLAPRAREIDDAQAIPEDLLREMGQLGLLGITIPKAYGGPGASVTQATLAGIEVGRGDVSMATAVYYLLCAGWSAVLAKYGTEECKRAVLPRVATGEWFLGIATTEAGGGSDLGALKTTAKVGKDTVHITGEKMFISGATEAAARGGGHLVLAKVDPEKGTRGMAFIYVPAGAKGVTVSKIDNMGRMGISTCTVVYDNAEVPRSYVLGEPLKGFKYAMDGFDMARVLVSAACIGAGERAVSVATEYLRQRVAFGQPLGKWEAIQFELADLYSRLDMVKLEVLKAAWLHDERAAGREVDASELVRTVAIGKLWAPQVALDLYKAVMVWFGAAGYSKDYEVEMGLRGVLSYNVGAEGALNIMRIILGRELLGPEFVPYK